MNAYHIIAFDVDSTLVSIEGLDWLASRKGVGNQVHHLTCQSMEGKVEFQSAMIQKMKIISPSRSDLVHLGQEYCKNIVPGTNKLISRLHQLGKEVWIVTGNFQPAVGILAKKLRIPSHRVICNQVFFSPSGKYLGFDQNSPLAQNGGKAKIVAALANKPGRKVVYVGDSVTDLETKNHVSLFVGFGGVSKRAIVKTHSDIYIETPSLLPLLDIVTGSNRPIT
jgi:phosphoserine phosphatase SerB